MDSFWAKLKEEGISKAVSYLVLMSGRPSSNPNYESAWRKWTTWCSRNFFLIYGKIRSDLYKQGLQYRTISKDRCANLALMNRCKESQ